jgi:glycosyltransferase involved in cell wall biosynthesis
LVTQPDYKMGELISPAGEQRVIFPHDAPGPLISIGMPVFNCEKTLGMAIRSILSQGYTNWELLLMEDGSSDRSLEVARSFVDPRISVFADGAHKGIAPRLREAVDMGKGEYFARMDGDDISYPQRLERQIGYLERHPEVDLLGCSMLIFNADGSALGIRLAPESHERICRHPWAGFQIGHPTWMGRTEWFRAHEYDAKAIGAEDQVLLLRSFSTSRFAGLPDILCGYREDRLVLRKILRSRYTFAIAVLREFFERGNYFIALGGVLQQCLKALTDTFAITTGLNYRILGHRAASFDQLELQRWEKVCAQLFDENEVSRLHNESRPTFTAA